jgi:tyrosinase
MAGSMVYRLRTAAFPAAHMERFREALGKAQELSDNRGYNHIAGFHGAPNWYCWHHQFSPRTPVQARLFLPWHRAYLWWLEQALQDRVDGVAIPWWDWTRTRRIPRAYASRTVDGNRNPLYSSRARVPEATPPINRLTRRRPGAIPDVTLPTTAELSAVMADSDWPSFSDRLEDIHDRVHGWVGGDMGDVTTAAFDPIFFAHHCMIDRLWYLWQVRHGNSRIPNDLLDLGLVPFGKSFREVLNVQQLGYEYAATATEVPIP